MGVIDGATEAEQLEGEGIDQADAGAALVAEAIREMAAGQDLQREGDRLYERYGGPLEAEHWGEYVMITRDGRTVMATTLIDAFVRGSEMLGSGHFLFKVGERVTMTLRSPVLSRGNSP